MNQIKTIGVITSGGDAPGMNAAVRAVVRTGLHYGYKMMLIKHGYTGLINGEIEEADFTSVGDTLQRGGTFIGTSRCPEFTTEDGQRRAAQMARVFDIDAIVVVGGDGSYKGAQALSKQGIAVVGIPGTIDNDIASTDYTIGFDTAMNTALDAIDKLRDTSLSHDRCSVVEVMGRSAGYIAAQVGMAAGADVVLVPEEDYDIDRDVIGPLIETRNKGKKHFIVVVAEGVGMTEQLSEAITKYTGVEARPTILGHIQRGGTPTLRDREMASRMGYYAVETIRAGRVNRIIGFRENRLVDYDIDEALAMSKSMDPMDVEISKILAQ
ncbi:MAG: 6-phosphofructokinase [Clostridia bacterium]|nr:6-phosphofructokinase [Clostridia bacterium]